MDPSGARWRAPIRVTESSYERLVERFCAFSRRRPLLVLGVVLLSAVPSWLGLRQIRLDTNLERLLPEDSRAVRWSEELSGAVGGGGYFSVLFEGDDADTLRAAVDATSARLRNLPGVRSVEARNPLDFVDRYRYALLREDQLRRLQEYVFELEEEVSPFVDDLGLGPDVGEDGPSLDDQELATARRYARMKEYRQSEDGTVFGMIVRVDAGIRNIDGLRSMFRRIDEIAADEGGRRGLWHGIAGNLRNRVAEFDMILGDLGRAGTLSLAAIVLTLAVSFRSLRVLPVVVLPLAVGLMWSFALVPSLVGDLNTITSFLGMVLFGMGVDYAIHLVKRYRAERVHHGLEQALRETFVSTGRSVLLSGVTTTLGLAVLALSGFRGFSDFGVVGSVSVAVITLATLTVLPATLVLGDRLGLVLARAPAVPGGRPLVPGTVFTAVLLVLLTVCLALTLAGARFDYDFSQLSASPAEMAEVRERHAAVFSGFSAPAAIYVVDDLDALDRLRALLRPLGDRPDPRVGNVASVRDVAPTEAEYRERLELIEQLQDSVAGRWTRRIEDPDVRELMDDLRAFTAPPGPPGLDDLPETIRRSLVARDGSGDLIVGVDTAGRSRDGRMTMAFTAELYDLELPAGVRGPTGDKPVLAEILWMVTSESPWLVALTLTGISLIVLVDQRALRPTAWILSPLLAGLVLTLGAMVALGWSLNFFNIVVLPTLLGLGVDHGVHYYRRWRELGGDVRATQEELFEPLTVASLTTVMGYSGMNLAHHPGLLAIGRLAVLGLACSWVAAVLLLPGLLRLARRPPARG